MTEKEMEKINPGGIGYLHRDAVAFCFDLFKLRDLFVQM